MKIYDLMTLEDKFSIKKSKPFRFNETVFLRLFLSIKIERDRTFSLNLVEWT